MTADGAGKIRGAPLSRKESTVAPRTQLALESFFAAGIVGAVVRALQRYLAPRILFFIPP